jgi:hydroxymethylpyrimidine pyrophosphatase-like HAD family hydrolase
MEADRGESLRLHNLLNDADTLAEMMIGRCEAGQWLDAYLLAAGIDQTLEDALHPDALALNRIAKRLSRGGASARARSAAQSAAMLASFGRTTIWWPNAHVLASSAVARCQRETSALVAGLARVVSGVDGGEGIQMAPTEEAAIELHQQAIRVRRGVAELPLRVRRTPLRLPSCFLNLDQSPGDVTLLVDEAVRRWPDRRHPTLVLGVRTSGSYLAPLATASLRAAGYGEVRQMTMRPGQLWLPEERRTLRWALESGARVFVLDDPPNTWATIRDAAILLRRLGFQPDSIVPLVQTFPSTPPPPGALAAHPMVMLPWERTEVSRRLDPAAVQEALAGLLEDGTTVEAVERLPCASQEGARAHAEALYRAVIRHGGRPPEAREIYVQGVGLGYMGGHALAVGEPLRRFLPELYGVSGGLLFREWLPQDGRISGPEDFESASDEIVDYVSSRARALPVAEDVSLRLKDRSSVRRALGRFLARPFGRVEIAMWPFTERAVRALLAVDRPSVVDARMAASSWFRSRRDGGGVRKIAFVGGAFSGYDMYCYDAGFDLAGAAASSESDSMEEHLRTAYAARTGSAVDPERWLLYQLVHLSKQDLEWDEISDPELERRMSSRIRRYLEDVLLQDVRPPAGGPLCAIDVDGVLESTPLGISATSAAGVRALRSLQRHGYRPVLVSGRSLTEVRHRCIHYRLAGGVGEYGAALYVTDGDRRGRLLTGDELRTLRSLRAELQRLPDVLVDEGYELAVRAYRLDRRGRRRSLTPEQLEAAVSAVPEGSVRAIAGDAQTDFMVEGATKATGLAALAGELGTSGQPPALAVGDSASDLPVLQSARLSFAPANAHRELREAGIPILSGSCQAGLEQAAAHLLGHRPGSCPICREPHLPARSRLLLSMLDTPPRPSLGAKAAWGLLTLSRLAWLPLMTRRDAQVRTPGAWSDGGRVAGGRQS